MSCCGSQRASFRREPGPAETGEARFWVARDTDFEYTGNGQLTVTGPMTGQIYGFSVPGARLRVHAADAPSLVSVPGLKIVR